MGRSSGKFSATTLLAALATTCTIGCSGVGDGETGLAGGRTHSAGSKTTMAGASHAGGATKVSGGGRGGTSSTPVGGTQAAGGASLVASGGAVETGGSSNLSGSGGVSASAGAQSFAGNSSEGSTVTMGGVAGSGDAANSGGTVATGGDTNSGGTVATGGDSGGTVTTGGVAGSGGVADSGGADSGGTVATAGMPSSGGVEMGGTLNTGGSGDSGGTSATGGTSDTGGTSSCSGPIGPIGTISGPLSTGVIFMDTDGNRVNAHGGGIIKVGNTYYMHGEYFLPNTTDTNFHGFSMYSSEDLATWKNEGIILPMQADGYLGPNRKGERPHIVRCPATGEFVLYAHAADVTYQADKEVVFATSPTVNGQYTFQGALQNSSGTLVVHSDMSALTDGNKAYVITESAHLYTLASDCHSWLTDTYYPVVNGDSGGGESPTIFKAGSTYYWLMSYKTGWRANNNFYSTAPAITGP
ncbi:MAG TPA: hypothetical protein VIV60_33880, partial [Polyangiaceae bacterium]